MERPSLWLMLVILLAAILFLREPRVQQYDEGFLRWLLRNSPASGAKVPLMVVDIGRDTPGKKAPPVVAPGDKATVSPLEFALFLQAALEFKPTVIGIETNLQWSDANKEQEQIFLDQAMHVPKLVVGAELTPTADLDAPVAEIPDFPNVTGRRGGLPEFSGIGRQPDEDIRLLATLGFVNTPKEVADEVHVPLLFQYRGEVIPSFALQTALLWMRVNLSEVKVDIGSYIYLPSGQKIPVRLDGTALINPNTVKRARLMKLNELLLAAQQHESETKTAAHPKDNGDQLILARVADEGQKSLDLFGATIATIQGNSFVRRVSWIFDCVFILTLVVLSGFVRKFSRIDIVLIAIAITAAYCLLALAILSRWFLWFPGVLPLGAVWLIAAFCLFAPRRKDDVDLPAIAPSPPSL